MYNELRTTYLFKSSHLLHARGPAHWTSLTGHTIPSRAEVGGVMGAHHPAHFCV